MIINVKRKRYSSNSWKGHEDYQIIGHTKHHFSDLEEVENYIKEKNS